MNGWGTDPEDDNNFQQQLPPGMQIVSMAQFADRQRLLAQEMKASIARLFDEMSGEQLYTLLRMLTYVVHDSQMGRDTAQFWTGEISAYLKLKFGMCSSCGLKHDDAEHILTTNSESRAQHAETFLIQRSTSGPVRQRQPSDDESISDIEANYQALNNSELARWCEIEAVTNDSTPARVLSKLTEYGVLPVASEDEHLSSVVYCVTCNTQFPSLIHRIENGKECPACAAGGRLSNG